MKRSLRAQMLRVRTSAVLLAFCFGYQPLASAAEPQPVGSTVSVRGVVTLSFGNRAMLLVSGTALFAGARVISGSNGFAELRFESGCTVQLEPNEILEIAEGGECLLPIGSGAPVDATRGAIGVLPSLSSLAAAAAIERIPERAISPTPR